LKVMKKGGERMHWIQDLYETYNNCQASIGAEARGNEVPLLPICHTTQKAQVEIVLDQEGNFIRASVIPRDDARTIIPCTESSGGRTSGPVPHPLCDKLQYVAKDYLEWGGSKDSCFDAYHSQLTQWCTSKFSDPKLTAVLTYVEKGQVVSNLVEYGILIADESRKLLPKWDKKKGELPQKIFGVLPSQEEAFIRWRVEIPGVLESRVWRDKILWDKWISYYSLTKTDKALCYVTGTEQAFADQHPAKIRNDGDKAKLISSNDSSGFTYRGRFLTPDQTASVGFEITQKAHFALRWLINRQGYVNGDQAIVAWATSGAEIPNPTDDPLSILGFDALPPDEIPAAWTAQEAAIQLKKRIVGYGEKLDETTGVIVMGLDSATPGRMSITFYRKLTGSDFLQRIENWHQSCAWVHAYRSFEVQDKETGKIRKQVISFIGAPSPRDIAEAAYGRRLDDKLRKATIERILPCIIDGNPIPRDLVESTYRRASNRLGMDNWEWNKTLTISCALFRKYKVKEKYDMTIELDRTTRDYLYGRLLALAESLESWALNTAHENRETSAARLTQRFAERPYSTWRTIELALVPYKARLGGKATKRIKMMDEVVASFNPEDFTSDKPLSGEFLLGYHCQREYLRISSEAEKEIAEETNEFQQAN